MKKSKIGVIGCGMISDAYFKGMKAFDMVEIVACADSLPDRAKAKSELHGISNLTIAELLASPAIEIVLNLTPPKAHHEIAMGVLMAGKHTYSEKPLGVDFAQAAQIMALANEKGLRVGCAPDTFLGGGQQTVRKMIDDGWIGKPIAGTAMVMGRGPEKWSQAPFFYDIGAGPMLDLGPYYITALVNMLGAAKSVTAVTGKSSETRRGGPDTVPRVYPIKVATHLSGIVEFQCGATITVVASFDVYKHCHSPIEIYGSEGTLLVPDPNTFGGPIRVFRKDYKDFESVPLSHIYAGSHRGIGVADMACALQSGRMHRANGELACHVLEIMLAFEKSSQLGQKVAMTTTCKRPDSLPVDLEYGDIDKDVSR